MPTLRWLTRDDDVKAADAVPYRLLEEVPELSYGERDTGNMLIQGDNLDALKALLPYYAGQVKCIYIDPPYNTQQAISELYKDNLEHSQWLGIMWPRLELLREFLQPDGYLVVQIDDREFARLYLIMVEIFGEQTLKVITVKMSEASGLKMGSVKRSGRIPKLKEYLILAKLDGIRDLKLDLVPKASWDTEYNIFLENFTKEDKKLIDDIQAQDFISSDDIERVDKIANRVELGSVAAVVKKLGLKGKTKQEWLFENAFRICQCATSSSVLKLTEAKKQFCDLESFFVTNKSNDILYFVRATYSITSKKPRVQLIFAEDNLSQHPGDLWTDIKTTGLDAEGKVAFKNGKKPEQLIRRIINLATEEGDYVMDSFGGSGTTAAVAHKMKRRWITIEKGEQAISHITPRLKRVSLGDDSAGVTSLENWRGGGGFRFFKLGNSIFDQTGQIRPDIEFSTLASHIWFYETGLPWDKPTILSPVLGQHNHQFYALLYNGILGDKRIDGGNVLTRQTLKIIRNAMNEKTMPIVIYGERSALSEKSLKRENITFKQTPYDVKARA